MSEFVRGFKKLVTDVVLGKVSSRTLNTNEDIRVYFESWDIKALPASKRGSFVPSDVVQGKSGASSSCRSGLKVTPKKAKQGSLTVLPRDFKVRFGNDRLMDIRRELTKLKRRDYPNAGAVLLRVFFELAVIDYLERTGELPKIVKKLEEKEGRNRR